MRSLVTMIAPSAAVMGAALPIGWGLSRLAQRLASPVAIKAGWLFIGAMIVCAISLIAYWGPDGSVAALSISLVLGCALLLLAAVDIATLRLPDIISLPLALLGLAVAGGPPFFDHLVGLIVGIAAIAAFNALYTGVRRKVGIGFGDAKLFGAAGAWLGWQALPSVLLVACAGGLAWVALRLLVNGRGTMAEPIPFGAPISLAFWSLWLCA